MPTLHDLCTWLRHNVEDLRLAPDMVTEAAGSTVRLRWDELVAIDGREFGMGIDLRPGPALGEVWLYGYGAREVRLHPEDSERIPPRTWDRLRSIMLTHVSDREHDAGRDRSPLFRPRRADAVA